MKALAARVASRRSGADAKRSTRKSGGTATAVLDEVDTEVEGGHVTPDDIAPTVVPTGPRAQPKKGTTRSKRKK